MTEEELFHAALAIPNVERAAFLDQACADNLQLRNAVEALLAAHEASGNMLDPAPSESSEANSDATPATREFTPAERTTSLYNRDAVAGAVIAGRYVLQEKIGEGGMGEVWVAKQTEPVKRKIALKLVKSGMDSKAVLRRFEAERQALALMDHPNIARVLDGGITPMGQPFFVMELVNGLPLGKFCDDAKLTTDQRLELFVPICQAVQHAHQKGIVHRDLKPANILVTLIDGKPVPKVIDFGIAKATAGKLIDETLSTAFGAVVGTLEYMSPEQAGFSGQDIDTRSDIYALGVILYELLTGFRPIDSKRLRQAALNEMIRIIQEDEPSKPSARLLTDESLPSMAALRKTEPRKLVALLQGELDWVVMKCLEKNRDHRYETANALARDIQRFLANEVVEARPPSKSYQLLKFYKRNKRNVIAAGLLLLITILGTVGTTIGLFEANYQKNEAQQKAIENGLLAKSEQQAKLEALQNLESAEANRERADRHFNLARKAVEDYLVEVTEDKSLKEADFHDLRERLLEMAAPFYEAFLKEPADNSSVLQEQARAMSRLGDIRFETGKAQESLDLFKQSLATWTGLSEQTPNDQPIRLGMIVVLERISRCQFFLGDFAESEQVMLQRNSVIDKIVESAPDEIEYRVMQSTGHSDLAKLYMEIGRLEDAKSALLKSLEFDNQSASQFSDQIKPKLGSATTLHNLALLHWQQGDQKEAEKLSLESLAIAQKLADENPQDADVRRNLAATLDHMGTHYAQTGRKEEAEAKLRNGLSAYQKLAADFPRVPQYRQELASTSGNLATLLLETNRSEESDQLLESSLAIYESLMVDYPVRTDFRQEFAYFLSNRAMLLFQSQKFKDAETACSRAVEIQEAIVRKSPSVLDNYAHIGKSLVGLGLIREGAGDLAAASTTFRQAITYIESALEKKPDHPFFLQLMKTSRENLAKCCNNRAYRLAAHPLDEVRNGESAVAIATEACELTEWKSWEYLDTLAAAYAEQGDFAQAIKWQEQAIKQLPLLSIFSRPKLQARLDLYKKEVPFRDKELNPN